MSSARIDPPKRVLGLEEGVVTPPPIHGVSKITLKLVLFHLRRSYHLFYTSQVISLTRTKVKLNRVFFPPLILPSLFPWLWFRWIVDRDSGNLVNPFMRVTN
ncbi:unnamed protein product [Brassica rapa subsp. narinosa]